MGDKVWQLSDAEFVGVWNAAGCLDEVVARVKEAVGPPAPRWAVLARATALRKQGADLRRFPLPTVAVPTA